MRRIVIFVAILSFAIGFNFGVSSNLSFLKSGYELGMVSFCDLAEIDRLKVCPMSRMVEELSTGCSLIIYMCNKNFVYVETNGLSESSQKYLDKLFKEYNESNIIETKCKSKLGTVYSMRKKTYND